MFEREQKREKLLEGKHKELKLKRAAATAPVDHSLHIQRVC